MQKLAKLHARIQELETKNDKLRLSLIEERERRQEAEIKLEEAAEASRGRMSLFMVWCSCFSHLYDIVKYMYEIKHLFLILLFQETSLSRMMRGVGRRGSEEDDVKSSPFSRSFQSPGVTKKTSQVQIQIYTLYLMRVLHLLHSFYYLEEIDLV